MGIPILANVIAPENSRNNGNAPEIKCLQIFGGLSTNPITLSKLITNIYPIHRQSTISTSTISTENVGKFISIGSSTSTTAAAAVVQGVPEQPKQQSTTTTTTTTGKTTNNND